MTEKPKKPAQPDRVERKDRANVYDTNDPFLKRPVEPPAKNPKDSTPPEKQKD